MASVTNRRARRQRERKAKRIQALHRKRRQRIKQWKGKKLTQEEKKIRSEKLKKRIEEKKKNKELENEIIQDEAFNKIMCSCFGSEGLKSLAKKVGFIKRSTAEMTAFAFVYIVSFALVGGGTISLSCLTSSLTKLFNIRITAQGLSKRINRKASVVFLEKVLFTLMNAQMKFKLKNKYEKIFEAFSAVAIEDSSQITLNEAISGSYQGSGGGASKACVKLNFIFDIKSFVVMGIKKTSGIVSDTANCLEILKYIKSGALIIRDLGYFSLESLKKIGEAGAFYISRLSISVNVYLNEEDKTPLNIIEYLEKTKKKKIKMIDIPVFLGKGKLKSRMIAAVVPEKVVKQRRERYKQDNKKEPSHLYMRWSGFSIFVTNIPANTITGEFIIILYKIRWQIELFFKNFKSNLELDQLTGTNKHRIDCLIYGKLIVILTSISIHQFAVNIAKDKEVSGDKLTKWLMVGSRLQQAVETGNFEELLASLEKEIHLVCKQKRTRKTTLEQIEAFLEREQEDIEDNQVFLYA
jgi:hypothetical protein